MTYNILCHRDFRVSLPILSTESEVNRDTVMKTVRKIIDNDLYLMNNPYEDARWVEVHNLQLDLPMPKTEEERESEENKRKLADWIMTTEEMSWVLGVFGQENPQKSGEHLTEEESEEITVQEFLIMITPMEGDWQ